jgi:hypothetical protein
MKQTTFIAAVLVIPLLLASAVTAQLYAVLDYPRLAALGAGVLLALAFALIGWSQHRSFWTWSRHQVVTGQDASRFVAHLLLLYLLPPVVGIATYRACSFYGISGPGFRAWGSGLLSFASLAFLSCREYNPFIRGTHLHTVPQARAKVVVPAGDPGMYWGGVLFPSILSLTHSLILGSVGAGKSLIVDGLTKRLLDFRRLDARAIIYDGKKKVLNYLDSLDLGVRVVILNPTDARCSAWALAKDIVTEDDANTLAEILVPVNDRASQPFFDDAARLILAAVVLALIRLKPGRWTLRDVVYCMRSMDRIKAILSLSEEGRELVVQYFSKVKTAQDVMSTIATKVGRFQSVAKAWDRATREGRTVSIDEWMKGNFIIVLGSSNRAAPTLRDLNRLFFKRVSQVLLDEPDNDQGKLLDPSSRRHYLFLDEVRFAGRLDGLNELFLLGRSKGVCITTTAQDHKGWEEVYGEKLANEQLSQAASIAVLRLQCPATAKWASELIGQFEAVQLSHSSSGGARGPSASESASIVVRDAVLPSEILRLPLTKPANGLTGFFLSPDVGVWKATIPWAEVMRERNPRRKSNVLDFVKAEALAAELRPWDEGELFELGITPGQLGPGNGATNTAPGDEEDGIDPDEATLEDFPDDLDQEPLQ